MKFKKKEKGWGYMFQPPLATDELEHPVVSIDSACQGMIQHSEFYYTVDENGRRVQVHNSTPKAGTMRRRMQMKLPLLLSPDVWIRHNYSLADVIETLNYYRSIHLWQLAVLLGIQLSSSSVKLSFSTPISMVFSSKAIVMCKIANHLRKYYTFPTAVVLDKTHEDHVPPLPVNRIPAAEYDHWKQRAPDRQDISMLSDNVIAEPFAWRNVLLAPMWMEGDCVYMIRVVDEPTFVASGREALSLATQPIRFRDHQNRRYCGLVDEAAFFLPN